MKKEKINSIMYSIPVQIPVYSSCQPLKNIFNTLKTQLSTPILEQRKQTIQQENTLRENPHYAMVKESSANQKKTQGSEYTCFTTSEKFKPVIVSAIN